MTLTQLEYIIALDESRHFVTASEKCFVTQPTLSMQVQKLEAELGVIIFDRKKQPLVPTKQGEEIIKRARKVLSEAKGIKEYINTEKNIVEGELRIGIIPTLAPYLLPLFLFSFLKKHPHVKPIIEELQSERLIEKLHNNHLDLGIIVTPLQEKNLQETPLFEERFAVYLSENHELLKKDKISTKDLENKELWVLNQGHCFRNQVLNICGQSHNKSRDFIYESGSLDTLRKMVEQNFGYTLLPQLALGDIKNKKLIRYFEEPQPVREVSLVVHNSLLKFKLIELIRKEILSNLPKSINIKAQKKQVIKWR